MQLSKHLKVRLDPSVSDEKCMYVTKNDHFLKLCLGCFFMVPGGSSWFFMVPGGFSCFFHGPRLFFHGSRSVFMVFHGSRSVFMVFLVSGWFFIFHVENTIKLYSGPTIRRPALA